MCVLSAVAFVVGVQEALAEVVVATAEGAVECSMDLLAMLCGAHSGESCAAV